jgi:hypothetical protein
MLSPDDCVRYAAECLKIAQQIKDPVAKASMLEMVERWRRLAEHIAHQETESSDQGQ